MDEDDWTEENGREYIRSNFEGVDSNGKKIELETLHHLDSGSLLITIDGAEEKTCSLDSDEWLRLLNCLLTQRKFRDWVDQRKEAKESREIMDRLKLFQEMGLQGRDLLQAAVLPKEES
jgi:hypothetical protein